MGKIPLGGARTEIRGKIPIRRIQVACSESMASDELLECLVKVIGSNEFIMSYRIPTVSISKENLEIKFKFPFSSHSLGNEGI